MGVDVLVVRGTEGGRDWYYPNANPIYYQKNVSPGFSTFYCLSDADPNKVGQDTWVKDSPKTLWNNAEANSRWGGHSYKTALLRTGKSTDPFGYAWWRYQNNNGTMEGGKFDGLTQFWVSREDFKNEYDISLWGNFTVDNAVGGGPSVYTFYGGLPAFDSEEVIDGKDGKERMEEYLTDDGDGSNWSDYGGFIPGDETPSTPEDDNVSEDIDGLGGSDDYTDSDSSIISAGVLGKDGLVKCAKLADSDYQALGTLISKGWLAGNIGEGVINVKMIRTPGELPTESHQKIIDASGTFSQYSVSGYPISNQYISYNVGSFTFNEQFQNFLDYSPYTSIKLYLPYCGLQELDAQIVVGKTINVKCVIDILSGNLVYYLFTKTSDGQTCLYSWNGNCSIDIPITADDYGRKVSATINAGATTLATLMNPGLGAVAGLGAAGINYAENSSQHMIMGNLSANNGFGGIQYPYLVISRPTPKIPSNFGHTTGYLSMQNKTLSSCSGFTKVSDVHLNGISGATQDELNEIESLLKSGVIL